jgi:hypothetical protein
MRTVHETEALRPSDPVPKHHSIPGATSASSAKLPRIKLKLSQHPKDGSHDTEAQDSPVGTKETDLIAVPNFGPELGFDEDELSLAPDQLCRLLRRQIHWAKQETTQLKQEWEVIEPQRKEAWREKELIFEDVIHAELRVFKSAMTAEDLALRCDANGIISEGGPPMLAMKGGGAGTSPMPNGPSMGAENITHP